MKPLLNLIQWNYLRQKNLFVLFTLAQVLLAISLLFGYPLVIGDIDPTRASYLTSGSVLIGIISIGCTISAPVVSNAKSEGHIDYLRALPVSRFAISLADLWMWLLAILPGVFFSILLGYLRFAIQPSLSITALLVLLLICLVMISLGFAIAYLFSPNTVTLMSQLILMIGLMFSPIMYPASRLPDIINQIYHFLPFVPAANLLRSSLYHHGSFSWIDSAILLAWLLLTQVLILATLVRES